MPLYEFYCPECSREFELLVSHSQADSTPCPECQHHAMERLMSVFSTKSNTPSNPSNPSNPQKPDTGAIMDHCSQAWKHV